MEHEDDSESEIVQLVNISIKKTYSLDLSQYSIAGVIKIHPCNGLHTCKMEDKDDSESEIIQTFSDM